jgi:hypothetical protein
MKRKPDPSNIRCPLPPEEYAAYAASSREYIRELAATIERGEPLTERTEAMLVAKILRERADQIADKEPGTRPDNKINYGDVATNYAILMNCTSMRKAAAIAYLAEANSVTKETITKAIDKYGEDALASIPKVPNLKNKNRKRRT